MDSAAKHGDWAAAAVAVAAGAEGGCTDAAPARSYAAAVAAVAAGNVGVADVAAGNERGTLAVVDVGVAAGNRRGTGSGRRWWGSCGRD